MVRIERMPLGVVRAETADDAVAEAYRRARKSPLFLAVRAERMWGQWYELTADYGGQAEAHPLADQVATRSAAFSRVLAGAADRSVLPHVGDPHLAIPGLMVRSRERQRMARRALLVTVIYA